MRKIILPVLLIFVSTFLKAQWSAVGGANALFSNYYIYSICTDASGNVYASGNFTNASGNCYVAKWTKATNTWSELGGNNSLKANAGISYILLDKSGNLYAGGYFTNASGYSYVAEWNGTTWSELGGTNSLAANYGINTMWLDAAGNIYASGAFTNGNGNYYVAKFNGTNWSELGGSNSLAANGAINSICTDPSGNVYAAGAFKNTSGKWYVAEWNGTNWGEVGGTNALSANEYITTICSDKSGNIYAGGGFNIPLWGEYVAKWNGANWTKVEGTDSIRLTSGINSIIADNSGNIYIAALCGFSSNGSFVGKWNGTSWTQLSMQSFPYTINGEPSTITFDSTGNLFIAGTFNDPNTFNTYVAEYAESALPVTLTSFNAVFQNKNVLLQWQTALEENTSDFIIQRSVDGTNFSDIAKVPAAGNSSVTKNYSYTDETVASLNSNTVFYRLAETDIDGAITYSIIRAINFTDKGLQFSVYPNPAKDVVNLIASTNFENAVVKVTDLSGKLLYQTKQNFVAGQPLQISISQYPSETLLIDVVGSENHQHFMIIKQ